MLKMNGMQQKIDTEGFFDEWTKELKQELPTFWTEFSK